MKLSSPIYVLKSQAKSLKKAQAITMSKALDIIAKKEGFDSWSLLLSKNEEIFPKKYCEILSFFNHGDLVLVGARPGKGKTSFTVGIFVQAIEEKRAKNYCFSLSENHKDIAGRISSYNQEIGQNNEYLFLNYSNDISAEYIMSVAKDEVTPGTIIVIDYLQLLDEKRVNPPLQNQVSQLKEFAKNTGCIIIFLSQIDRSLETRLIKRPILNDIRLPNPLDLNIFNKVIFLYKEDDSSNKVEVSFSGKQKHVFNINWNKNDLTFSDI
jgi:replicative DNA helicase